MTRPDPHVRASTEPDDTAAGLAMFLIFTAAVLIVTAAVVVVALAGAWWLVGVAFAIHLLMTAVVIVTIVSVMNGRASGSAERAAAETRPGGRREPAAALP